MSTTDSSPTIEEAITAPLLLESESMAGKSHCAYWIRVQENHIYKANY